MPELPVSAGTLRKLLREIARSGRGEPVLSVGGASEHAHLLRQQLLRGRAEPGAVRLGGPEGAAAYVHVLAASRATRTSLSCGVRGAPPSPRSPSR